MDRTLVQPSFSVPYRLPCQKLSTSHLRADGISSCCYIKNVHNHPSWDTSRKEGMAWYFSRPMTSLRSSILWAFLKIHLLLEAWEGDEHLLSQLAVLALFTLFINNFLIPPTFTCVLLPNNTPHITLGNEQCLKLILGVCNTKKRGDLTISLVTVEWYTGGIFKLLRSPLIDSKESILPAYVAWRADTMTLFLLGS